jgi:hypothetical protein
MHAEHGVRGGRAQTWVAGQDAAVGCQNARLLIRPAGCVVLSQRHCLALPCTGPAMSEKRTNVTCMLP